jgi:hypothetical protein
MLLFLSFLRKQESERIPDETAASCQELGKVAHGVNIQHPGTGIQPHVSRLTIQIKNPVEIYKTVCYKFKFVISKSNLESEIYLKTETFIFKGGYPRTRCLFAKMGTSFPSNISQVWHPLFSEEC